MKLKMPLLCSKYLKAIVIGRVFLNYFPKWIYPKKMFQSMVSYLVLHPQSSTQWLFKGYVKSCS